MHGRFSLQNLTFVIQYDSMQSTAEGIYDDNNNKDNILFQHIMVLKRGVEMPTYSICFPPIENLLGIQPRGCGKKTF